MRRKWTYRHRGERPRTSDKIEAFIVRFVRENAEGDYGKIAGELGKLGYEVSEPTIANVLARHRITLRSQSQRDL